MEFHVLAYTLGQIPQLVAQFKHYEAAAEYVSRWYDNATTPFASGDVVKMQVQKSGRVLLSRSIA